MSDQRESQNNSILQLNKICRRYGTGPFVDALVDVDLQLESGEWLAITGPSGAGKSTLLNILGCLDRPTSGSYFVDGINTSTLTDKERAGLRSQHIGFVFQSFHLLAHRSVLENVMLAETYRKQPRKGREERALAALEKVGLGDRAYFLPTKLSGGQKQRVAIARALVGSPSLLLCDEPTGNLDSKTTDDIMDLFVDLNEQGYTLVFVTHNEEVAKRAVRRVEIIDGRLKELSANRGKFVVSDTTLEKTSVARSGITFQDLLDEALAGMFARPGRMALTLLGVLIGLTALVATVGLSRTTSNRILGQFDELAATEIVVTAKTGPNGGAPDVIPWDAPQRLLRLNGLVTVGNLSQIDIGNTLVSATFVRDPRSQTAFNLPVQAASPGLFEAVRADLATGRFFDLGHSDRADRVAILGPGAALRLGITGIEQLPAIAIGDRLYLVIGIVNDVGRQPDLLGSVIIPEGTARHDFNLVSPQSVIIETQIGAASLIAQQTPLALRPDTPALLKIASPPEPQRVRDAVQSDLDVMLLMLGGLSLIVGAIGIGNIMLVSIIERTGEIGLRRSIGATRTHIAAQFLLEGTSLGFIGGILGSSLGILVVVGVSIYQVWTPILDWNIVLLAPLIGGTIGLVSSTYPSIRAALLEPVEAFRH